MEATCPDAPRALIVDNHQLVRELMGRMIEHFGYGIAGFATDGLDAIEQARICDPDFILMDLNMPVMDGIEATARIFAERQVPILICTGSQSPDLADRARQAGACGILVKPCASEKLREYLYKLFPVASLCG